MTSGFEQRKLFVVECLYRSPALGAVHNAIVHEIVRGGWGNMTHAVRFADQLLSSDCAVRPEPIRVDLLRQNTDIVMAFSYSAVMAAMAKGETLIWFKMTGSYPELPIKAPLPEDVQIALNTESCLEVIDDYFTPDGSWIEKNSLFIASMFALWQEERRKIDVLRTDLRCLARTVLFDERHRIASFQDARSAIIQLAEMTFDALNELENATQT